MRKTLAIAALAALSLGAFAAMGGGTAEAQLQLRAPAPQPGTCKAAPVMAQGPSAAAAQAVWANQVSAVHGANWSIWAGAADKSVVPTAAGGTTWQARARPCFYHPVR
ncbi:hypothetical protein [Salinarimonas rosea]|uniref:hypothetical protein n=1 Tax=Salinarimonas rosea TaxID=552063 RepID=UPI00041EF105|nr:hypothetical protein [Salinarimonas rosea]